MQKPMRHLSEIKKRKTQQCTSCPHAPHCRVVYPPTADNSDGPLPSVCIAWIKPALSLRIEIPGARSALHVGLWACLPPTVAQSSSSPSRYSPCGWGQGGTGEG